METEQIYTQSKLKFQHYKELFNVPESDILSLFESVLFTIPCSVECSNKISQDTVFSQRLNLWFFTVNPELLKLFYVFFANMQKNYHLDTSLFEKLIHGIDVEKVKQLTMGIDLREVTHESRIKFWTIVDQYPQIVNTCLDVHGSDDSVRQLVDPNATFLFGFDFLLHGGTRLKIYPLYDGDNLTAISNRTKFTGQFCETTTSLASLCKRIHISFSGKHFKKVVHFTPKDPGQFLEKIQSPMVHQIDEKYQRYGYHLQIASFLDEELASGQLKEVNLYY